MIHILVAEGVGVHDSDGEGVGVHTPDWVQIQLGADLQEKEIIINIIN